MEIERKFLVSELPDLRAREPEAIEQGYLASGADGEVRVRRRGRAALLTVKRGAGLAREETEIALSGEQFEALWPLTKGRRVSKKRYRLPHAEHEIELDLYEESLEGLVVAEVEFGSEEDAHRFDPPGWLGEDVTGDDAYMNRTLAVQGAPR